MAKSKSETKKEEKPYPIMPTEVAALICDGKTHKDLVVNGKRLTINVRKNPQKEQIAYCKQYTMELRKSFKQRGLKNYLVVFAMPDKSHNISTL